MNILVLTRTAWRKDNSLGNTYSNLFGNIRDIKIGNVYLGDGLPDRDNLNVISYFRISEKEIVKGLLNPKKKVGEVVSLSEINSQKSDSKNETYDKALISAKKKRWPLMFMARELFWRFGHPNYSGLVKYVKEFNPDIIFVSFYYAAYVDRIALFIKNHFNVPMVLEAAIDIYSLRQFSLDPFFWINRFYIRGMIRKTVKKAEHLYVISEEMKKDYEKMLKIPCSVLYKFPEPSRRLYAYTRHNKALNFLYTGNIGIGRWKTLAELGKVISEENIGCLHIFTPTPITEKMSKALSFCDVNPPISAEEVVVRQNEADVLIHVESFDLANKLEVRYSISTKIMDYISTGRCIMAIGPSGIASIEFLRRHKLAVIANSESDVRRMILRLKNKMNIIETCANNNVNYINRNLKRNILENEFRNSLENIIQSYHVINR